MFSVSSYERLLFTKKLVNKFTKSHDVIQFNAKLKIHITLVNSKYIIKNIE